MVKVSMEVRSGAAHFDVAVQAESIQRAMNLVRERYSKANVRVKFPLDPAEFFADDVAPQAELIEFEAPQEKTAA